MGVSNQVLEEESGDDRSSTISPLFASAQCLIVTNQTEVVDLPKALEDECQKYQASFNEYWKSTVKMAKGPITKPSIMKLGV
jgi:hypothetical protein